MIKYRQLGFTLLELIVVLAIIGILATIVTTSVGPSRNKADEQAILETVRLMQGESVALLDERGRYPSNLCDQENGPWANYFKKITEYGGTPGGFAPVQINGCGLNLINLRWAIQFITKAGNQVCADSRGNFVYPAASFSTDVFTNYDVTSPINDICCQKPSAPNCLNSS